MHQNAAWCVNSFRALRTRLQSRLRGLALLSKANGDMGCRRSCTKTLIISDEWNSMRRDCGACACKAPFRAHPDQQMDPCQQMVQNRSRRWQTEVSCPIAGGARACKAASEIQVHEDGPVPQHAVHTPGALAKRMQDNPASMRRDLWRIRLQLLIIFLFLLLDQMYLIRDIRLLLH